MTEPAAPNVLTIPFTTTAAEQVRASRVVMLRTFSMWVLFGLFVVLPIGELPFMEQGPGEAPWMVWIPLPIAAAGLVFWYYFPWIPVLATRRGMKEPNGPFTVTLDENGVTYMSPHARVELQWGLLVRGRETSEFFLLYVGKGHAQFIPKRVVSGVEAESIRSLLQRKLPGKVALLEGGAG